MESFYTLPADAFVQTNGSPAKTCSTSHPLAGNIVWAVGHQPDSNTHMLHFFDGIKGGTFQWHTFRTPKDTAEEIELELALEGSLGLRMDRDLFLGTVQSVADSCVNWKRAALACRDFQMGRDTFCYRSSESDSFVLTQIEQLSLSQELPPPPEPPDCYCLSSRDDLLLLSGPLLLILSPPYSHWVRVETAAPGRWLNLLSSKQPTPSRMCLSRSHLCSLSQDGQTLSLLPIQPQPCWQNLSLRASARQICPVRGASLSFLLLDRHFCLSHLHLDTGSLRAVDLSSFLPERDVFSSVRAIRSIFDNSSDSLSDMASCCSSAPVLDAFFTAAPSDPLEMEFEPASAPPPADSSLPFDSNHTNFNSVPSAELPFQLDQSAELPFQPDQSAELPFQPDQSAELPFQPDQSAELPFQPGQSAELPFQPGQSADSLIPIPVSVYAPTAPDWLLSQAVFSNNIPEVRTGCKRPNHPESVSPHKLIKSENLDPPADVSVPHNRHMLFHTGTFLPVGLPARTSEEQRTDKRFLRDNSSPCPLGPYSFVPLAPNVSHFEELLEEARAHAGMHTPIEQAQGLLFEEFDFSLARKEVSCLSRLFPESPPAPDSPPPPSAPPTVDIPLFQL